MANEIDTHLTTQFAAMLHVEQQQIRSRLRPHVLIKQMSGDLFAYDGLGSIEAREVQGRVEPTVFDAIDHLRRKIKRRRFVVTLPIDSSDVRGMLLNPSGAYAQACIRAYERQFDRVGVEASLADVETGRDFATTVTAANDGVQALNALTAIEWTDLLTVNERFRNQEVGNDIPVSKIMLITGDEEDDLLQEPELTSGDFTSGRPIQNGELLHAAGIKFLIYGADVANPILKVVSTTRDCLAMAGNALCYGMSKEMGIKIQERPDYVETTQVQITGELGAVRTEGVLMQEVNTTA